MYETKINDDDNLNLVIVYGKRIQFISAITELFLSLCMTDKHASYVYKFVYVKSVSSIWIAINTFKCIYLKFRPKHIYL